MYGGKSSTGCESLYKKRTRSRRARTLKASRTDRFFHTCSLLTSQIYIFQLILSPHTEFHQSTRKTIRPEQTSPGSWFLLRSLTVSRSRGGDFFSKNRNEKRKSDPLSSRRQRSREREREQSVVVGLPFVHPRKAHRKSPRSNASRLTVSEYNARHYAATYLFGEIQRQRGGRSAPLNPDHGKPHSRGEPPTGTMHPLSFHR